MLPTTGVDAMASCCEKVMRMQRRTVKTQCMYCTAACSALQYYFAPPLRAYYAYRCRECCNVLSVAHASMVFPSCPGTRLPGPAELPQNTATSAFVVKFAPAVVLTEPCLWEGGGDAGVEVWRCGEPRLAREPVGRHVHSASVGQALHHARMHVSPATAIAV